MHNLIGGTEKMMMKMLQEIKPSRYDTNKLQNTDEFDSKETKNNQVSINLVDNSIVDYHNQLNDIIIEEMDKEIPFIDLIKNNNYNNNKRTACRIHIKLSTIDRLQKWYERKYNDYRGVSKEVELILDEYLDKVEAQSENETATSSSSCIVYNGRTPRIDVLKKLLEIADELKNNSSQTFSKLKLLRIARKQDGIGDSRTVKKYHECLFMYSIKRNLANVPFDQFNMTGFRSGVLYLINEQENTE